METLMPETITSIPTFHDYVQDRRYIRNVSAKTLEAYGNAWAAFGAHVEPLISAGISPKPGILAAVTALLGRGMKPISVNSYLTAIRSYVYWLHNEGFLKEKFKVSLLKCEKKVI